MIQSSAVRWDSRTPRMDDPAITGTRVVVLSAVLYVTFRRTEWL